MWKIIPLIGLAFILLNADDCVNKERAYTQTKQAYDNLPRDSTASVTYDICSKFIDAGVDYMAHCVNDGR